MSVGEYSNFTAFIRFVARDFTDGKLDFAMKSHFAHCQSERPPWLRQDGLRYNFSW